MLFAAALFMQELQLLLGDREGDDIGPVQPAVVQTNRGTPDRVQDEDSPVLTDGVLHALNCTYTEYRETHFDECVDEPSQVYPRPIGDDPGGAWNPDRNRPVLLAHLDNGQSSR